MVIHFLTLDPKIGVPENCTDAEDENYVPQNSSSDRLLIIMTKDVG